MISDYFTLAFRNLRKRKLRSWLTMLGIIISIATIFILISVSVGLKEAVSEQFRLLGTDKFFIQPLGQLGPPGTGGAVQLTLNDLEIIKKVKGVKGVTGFVLGNGKIQHDSETRYAMVIGVDLDSIDLLTESMSIKIKDGRFFKDSDTNTVVLGYSYKYGNKFSKPISVGDTVSINDVEFKVRGIVDRIGNPSDDSNIYLSSTDARVMFNAPLRIDSFTVQIESGEDMNSVVESVKRKLMKFRDVTEKTRDFSILTPEELLGSFGTILNILTAFLSGIAAISLLVGGIGIANTMFTSVLERTKEIGTMKAIGAKNSDILNLFLIESGLLGLVGGLAGVVLGYLISKLIESIATNQLGTTLLRAAAPASLIIGCLLFAFLAGAISGVWPAWRASKLKTVDAIRYE